MRPLHCETWDWKGLTHLLTFQSGENIKQHLFCHQNCSFQLPQIRLPFPPMIICPTVSSQKTKSSHHPRPEQANKHHSSCLTPALTGLWVGSALMLATSSKQHSEKVTFMGKLHQIKVFEPVGHWSWPMILQRSKVGDPLESGTLPKWNRQFLLPLSIFP